MKTTKKKDRALNEILGELMREAKLIRPETGALDVARLSVESGVAHGTLAKMLSSTPSQPTLKTLKKLAATFSRLLGRTITALDLDAGGA